MDLSTLRILSLVIIALIYMLFDLFNKRNVPSVYVYATLVYGVALTILYLDLKTILISGGIALVVLGIGYVVYKIGQLGAADVVEFAALSLMLPFQKVAPFHNASQLGLPFIVSLLIDTGIAALIIVPLYYIPKARSKLKKPLTGYVTRSNVFLSAMLVATYFVFILFTVLVIGINYIGIIILIVMMVSSSLVTLFSVPITYSMIDYVTVRDLEEGDIIATNIMNQKERRSIKSRVKGFDRLVTPSLMQHLKEKKVKEKLPVYKKAMPFALAIFIGLVSALILGNLLLFILKV